MTGALGWTDDRIATLKKLWVDGLSASEIAKELGEGATRNSVISKVHRLKLVTRPSVTQRRDPKPPRPRKERKIAMPRKAAVERPAYLETPGMEIAPPPPVEAWLPLHGSTPVKLELHKDGCRWPIGDPALFCNAHVHGKGPYCDIHHRRGNIPIERKKKAA